MSSRTPQNLHLAHLGRHLHMPNDGERDHPRGCVGWYDAESLGKLASAGKRTVSNGCVV